MSITFTKEEVDAKIAEFDEQIKVLVGQREFWIKIQQMTPETIE